MKNILILSGVALALSGCAISMNMPTVRFDTPEAQGKLGMGYIGGGGASGNKLDIVPDTLQNPPVDQREFTTSGDIPTMVDVGLWDRLDVELRSSNPTSGTVPWMLKLKYQLVGDPRISSKEGNFSIATTVGAGLATHSEYDTDLFFTNSSVTANFWDVDFGLIFGYRLADKILMYGGPFYTHYGFSGTIDQTGNLTSPEFNFSGNANQEGVNLGFSFEFGFLSLRPELAVTNASSGIAHTTQASGGLLFAIQW